MWGIEKGGIGKGNLGFDCDVLLRMYFFLCLWMTHVMKGTIVWAHKRPEKTP